MESWPAYQEFEPVSLKNNRVGKRCALNLSRAQTSSRWWGVEVRRGGGSSSVTLVAWIWFKMTRSITKSPRVTK
ncbi:hypothetical protein TNCV_3528701 [Trichonephila clavipes]|nr:hypothetical protein TNCV_3528701 [Trichonephila clavipes]